MKKYKAIIKKAITLISAVFLLFSVSVYAYADIIESYNAHVQEFTGRGEISITDSYDSEKSELGDFFREKNSYKILRDTYTRLIENKHLHYYEVLPQSVEYIGNFKCVQSIVNGDRSCVEQKIDGELITPLKTIMINLLFADDINLKQRIAEGKMFEKIEYELDSKQIIPVILGTHYAKNFSINDTFEGYYLGSEKILFKVKGFLKPGTKIALDNEVLNLDDFLIAPAIKVSSTNTEFFSKLLMLIKCEGYLHYNDKSEYERALYELKKISNATGFHYSIPKRMLEHKNIFGIKMATATLILFGALFCLQWVWLFYLKK